MARMSVLLALIATSPVAQSGTECTVGDLHGLPQNVLKEQLQKEFLKAAIAMPDIVEFVQSSTQCQWDCFWDTVFPTSVETYLGRWADGPHDQDIAIEILTGAIRTCFPAAPREEVFALMKNVTENMYTGNETEEFDNSSLIGFAFPACPSPPLPLDPGDLWTCWSPVVFQAMDKATEKHPQVMEYDIRDCQNACVQTTIEAAFLTLLVMGADSDDIFNASFTGALGACVPGIPYELRQAYVSTLYGVLSENTEEPECLTSHPPTECTTGDLKAGPQADLKQTLAANFYDSMLSMETVSEFLQGKLPEQHCCFKAVFNASVDALLGKWGDELFTPYGQTIAIEALTGAVRTCYPSPPREEVHALITAAIDKMSEDVESTPFPECTAEEPVDAEAWLCYGQVVNEAFQQAVSQHPNIMRYNVLSCQEECFHKTIEMSFLTSLAVGDKIPGDPMELGKASVTGALRACIPGIPYPETRSFTETLFEELMSADTPDCAPKTPEEPAKLWQAGPVLGGSTGVRSVAAMIVGGGICALVFGTVWSLARGLNLFQREVISTQYAEISTQDSGEEE